MANVALQFHTVRERGVDMTPPDRMENVARLIAYQPTRGDMQRMARHIRRIHPPSVHEPIIERARAIYVGG